SAPHHHLPSLLRSCVHTTTASHQHIASRNSACALQNSSVRLVDDIPHPSGVLGTAFTVAATQRRDPPRASSQPTARTEIDQRPARQTEAPWAQSCDCRLENSGTCAKTTR